MLGDAQEESANKDAVVAQSVRRVDGMLMARVLFSSDGRPA